MNLVWVKFTKLKQHSGNSMIWVVCGKFQNWEVALAERGVELNKEEKERDKYHHCCLIKPQGIIFYIYLKLYHAHTI